MENCIIYTRVSTGTQADEGTSLETQEIACRRVAMEQGFRVLEHYQDAGVSGALYAARPGIQSALKDIEDKKASALIIYKLDRSGRDVDIARDIAKRVFNAGGRLFFTDDGEAKYDSSGKVLFTMKAAFAEMEKDVIKERTMKGRASVASKGIQVATKPPYGYHIVTKSDIIRGEYSQVDKGKYFIIEEEAEVVRLVYSLYASGKNIRQICDHLNGNGIGTPRNGGTWGRSTIAHLITSTVYIGEATYGRVKNRTDETRIKTGRSVRTSVIDSTGQYLRIPVPPIVDKGVWLQCLERRKDNKTAFNGAGKRRSFLSTILRCGECGGTLHISHGTRNKFVNYRCSKSCGAALIRSDVLENAIRNCVLEAAENGENIFPELILNVDKGADSRERLTKELAQIARQEETTTKAQIAAMMEGNDGTVYLKLLNELNLKRRQLQEGLDNLVDAPPMQETVSEICKRFDKALEVWDCATRTIDEKYDIMRSLFESITPRGQNVEVRFRYLKPAVIFKYALSSKSSQSTRRVDVQMD